MPGTGRGHSVRSVEEDPIGYVYAQVADRIEQDIRTGRLPRGARLPNERALAEEYGIAPGTARRAVRELRDRGMVRTLPNKGTFVVWREDSAAE